LTHTNTIQDQIHDCRGDLKLSKIRLRTKKGKDNKLIRVRFITTKSKNSREGKKNPIEAAVNHQSK